MATTSTLDVPATLAEAPALNVESLRDRLTRQRNELCKLLKVPGASGMVLARRHAEVADELASKQFIAASRSEPDLPVLLGAVGAYGRGLLALGSDLDLCFLTTEAPERVGPLVEAFMYPLWDANVNVGHQIVRLADVAVDADREIEMATELLDFRPLAGNALLMQGLRERLTASIFSEERILDFIAQLEAHALARHEQFGDSVYLLEPDVKKGSGGLRDLDYALWAVRVRYGTSTLNDLLSLGVLTEERCGQLEKALDFIWTVRNHLHHLAGRRADRLTFAEQEMVARALGYAGAANPRAPRLHRTGQMVEAFMSDYYRNARVIAHSRDRILGYAKRRPRHSTPPIADVGGGLVACEGRLGLAVVGDLGADPALSLRVYATAAARGMQILSRTRDAIAGAVAEPSFCDRLRNSREAAELFVGLLCTCRSTSFATRTILDELHDVGLLLAMVPEFAPVVGRVHHDLYHVYTVDVHSVAAVDRLRALTRGDMANRLPLASRLAAEATRPRVLFLATLLHDVGKAIGGHGHAQRGAGMARKILARLGLPEDEIDDACHLILHHLTMYMMAVRRDLHDPNTIAEFGRVVRGREGLRELYLLTVADVSTTSTVAMTKWKRSMLDTLFRATDAHLSGDASAASDRVARVQARARALFEGTGELAPFEQFLASMPARYFLSNRPEEVVSHARLALGSRPAPVKLSVLPSSHEDVMGLCVVTEERVRAQLSVVAGDRPGLLASIAAAISANRFAIQAAQVNSRTLPDGGQQAVDLFWVRATTGDPATNEQLKKLEQDLVAVIDGSVEPATLIRPRGQSSWSTRPTPPVFTEVVFDHHGSSHYTIIEVLTEDRRGLLYVLAAALHQLGVSIHVAKISTEGKRAIDVFYVAELDGSKIPPGPRTDEIRAALISQAL